MSEEQNAALIQKLYDAFGRGDVQTILDNLTADVDWGMEGPAAVPFTGQRKGPAEVMGFFEALATTQTNQKLTVETLLAQGDTVAMVGRYAATVTATGKNFDTRVAHFFTVRDGKVARLVEVGDTAALVEAYTKASAAGN